MEKKYVHAITGRSGDRILMMQEPSMTKRSREHNHFCCLGWSYGITLSPVTQNDINQLLASMTCVCRRDQVALSSKFCYNTISSRSKRFGDCFHIALRKHVLTLTHPGWWLSWELVSGWELVRLMGYKMIIIKLRNLPLQAQSHGVYFVTSLI